MKSNRISRLGQDVLIALCLCGMATVDAQQVPTAVQAVRINNITSSATVIDNRSTFVALSDFHTFTVVGSGTWTVQIQYSDTASTGPWVNFPETAALVTNTTVPPNGSGTGYHNFIRFLITGIASINYAGTRGFYVPTSQTGSIFAPVTGPYLLLTPNGSLTGAFAMSTLGTGILKNTTVTGQPSIAVGADLPTGIPIASIDTGTVTATEYNFVHNVTSPIQTQFGAKAAIAACPGGQVAIATLVGGITCVAVNMATMVTGTLALANGGTNGTDAASNGGIIWSNASQYKVLAGTATANQPLVSGATATPAWLPYSIPATIAAHQTLIATSTTAVAAKTWPDCQDSAGNHINYTQSTDSISCGSTGGSGGSGANFPTVTLATNTLTWGTGCTVLNPCVLGPSSNPVSYTAALGTVTSPVGSGTLFGYISSAGVASVGYPSGVTSLTCTTCIAVPGVTQFPEGSIAIFTDVVTANVFGTPSLSLQAGGYGYIVVNAGSGLQSSLSGNTKTISALPIQTSTGTSVTLSGNNQIFGCTSTCTVTVPVPVAGVTYCVFNDNNIATVITLSAIGTGAMYQNTAGTAYGTAGSGTMVSSGALNDSICILGRDATHYWTRTFNGSWTAN